MLLFVNMTHLVAEELEPLVVGDARGLLARRRRHRHDREEHVDALLAQQALARLRGERAVLRVAHAAVRQRVLHVIWVGAFGGNRVEDYLRNSNEFGEMAFSHIFPNLVNLSCLSLIQTRVIC